MKPYTCVFLLVILSSCTPYPQYTYYELDDAVKNAATEEERKYHEGRREYLEERAIEAGEFLQQLNYCNSSNACQVWCDFTGIRPRNGIDPKPEDIADVDRLVRWYMRVRAPTCYFIPQGLVF